jgi:hypothetical protein
MIRIVHPASWNIKEEMQTSIWNPSVGMGSDDSSALPGGAWFLLFPAYSGQQHARQLPARWRRENAGFAQHIAKYGRSYAEVGGANGK